MKTVLIDTTKLAEKGGFGTINDNYSKMIVKSIPHDMRFVMMVKEKDMGFLGPKVQYVALEHLDRDIKALPYKIDLWHSTDQLYLKRRHRKGMVNLLTVHDLNMLRDKKGIHRIKSFLKLRLSIMRSDYITVISQYVKDDLLKHINVGRRPVKVIYNGIPDNVEIPEDKPQFIKSDRPFFFTIGQIRAKKNFISLVPMMKYFPDTDLYICGLQPRKKDIEKINDKVRELKLSNVHLTGGISNDEKVWMYAHCRAFLFPSLLEGFGLPVLEAMRYGAKVFSSRCTSLPEVCGGHASFFNTFEPEQMAKTVKEGLKEWKRGCKEAISAYNYSMNFTFKKYSEQYIRLYRQLLGI